MIGDPWMTLSSEKKHQNILKHNKKTQKKVKKPKKLNLKKVFVFPKNKYKNKNK